MSTKANIYVCLCVYIYMVTYTLMENSIYADVSKS